MTYVTANLEFLAHTPAKISQINKRLLNLCKSITMIGLLAFLLGSRLTVRVTKTELFLKIEKSCKINLCHKVDGITIANRLIESFNSKYRFAST